MPKTEKGGLATAFQARTILGAYVSVAGKGGGKPYYQLLALARELDVMDFRGVVTSLKEDIARGITLSMELDPDFLSFTPHHFDLEVWSNLARVLNALKTEYPPCILELREKGKTERMVREADLLSIKFSQSLFDCTAEFQLRPGVKTLWAPTL